MGQHLKEMFERDRKEKEFRLKEGHEVRFIQKLDAALPEKKKEYRLLKIAASFLVLFGLGTFTYLQWNGSENTPVTVVEIDSTAKEELNFSFGDLSPDLKKVENYYLASINLELSKLEVSDKNKDIVDSFMERLSELNQDYEELTEELHQMGPNDQTITALIENLQLRLALLKKLKKKLNQLKSSKNEQITKNSI